MGTNPVTAIAGRAMPLPGDEIDTDRIIPARYLKCVTFDGLGEFAFHDERFDERGAPKEHPFNDGRYEGAEVLVVGANFGCGSSREHAPQALMRSGIRAVVGASFAEIFAGNCAAIGVPAVTLTREALDELTTIIEAEPGVAVTVDLTAQTVSAGSRQWPFAMPEADRKALTSGHWDTTGVLLANREDILQQAREIPYVNGFAN